MRLAAAVAIVVATTALGVGLAACIDLFHSTSDVRTACQIDAETPGCVDAATDGGTDAAIDFCAWTSGQALQNAQHACAWLGACETPMGRNAFGSCMLQALLSYDCHANPAHPVRGKAHDLWSCLSLVQTCADVDTCVFPHGRQPCASPGDITACATALDSQDVRVECVDGGFTNGENCALWGQTCTFDGTVGACAGNRDGGLGCSTIECEGTQLHFCTDAGDVGIDCADNGAGACNVFYPDDGGSGWPACIPLGAGSCSPDDSAQCPSGLASSCPARVPEKIDCDLLLGTPGSCSPAALSPPFDWTSACVVPVDPNAGPCAPSCAGTKLTDCARNALFKLDCSTLAAGSTCRMVTTDNGAQTHPACTPP